MNEEIDQMLNLRRVDDDVRRGHLFEQAIRELLPWDFRPPLAMLGCREQIDAFYEWNSWHFLVEAKAKRKPITGGSHDWEDFELKLRKRNGSCVGLFASLFPVAPGVLDAATKLNEHACPCIVFDGNLWDELAQSRVTITDLLRYSVLHAKANHMAAPRSVRRVHRWCYDHKNIQDRLHSICRSLSATFLRRHALPKHSQFYVRRSIDVAVENAVAPLRPSSLGIDRKLKTKKRSRKDGSDMEYTVERARPPQICLLRDASGAGKTTLSVQIGLTSSPYFGVARAALEVDVDTTLSAFRELGPLHGLNSLVEVNQALVCVIDSLDEATTTPGKRSEVISLIRYLEDLNSDAASAGLIAYPLLLVFTIREDYWLQWQSAFEGVPAEHFRNHFSLFGPTEFSEALDKYASAYEFVYHSIPDEDASRSLSVPFNLHVFSEANEYSSGVSFTEAFDESVLQLYFERKRDNVLRRSLPGLSGTVFLKICSHCALFALERETRTIRRDQIAQVLRDHFPAVYPECEYIAMSMASEGILGREPDNPSLFRFKHSRFIEYLVARYIVQAFDEQVGTLDDLSGKVYQTGVVSMFRVHDFVRFVCAREYPDLLDRLMKAYSRSEEYMTEKVKRLRVDIGHGGRVSSQDLDLIRKSLNTSRQEIAWGAFLLFAAKRNNVAESWIWEAYEAAWKSLTNVETRWRILARLYTRGLLLHGKVLERVLESTCPLEWEYFIGCILEDDTLRTVWQNEFAGITSRVQEAVDMRRGVEWERTRKLWQILRTGEVYLPGDI